MSWKKLASLSAEHLSDLCERNKESVRNLTVNKNGDNPLIISARMGRKDLVEVLLQYDLFCVNACNKEAKTALHEASQQSHVGITGRLLLAGASVNSLKRGDWTPLMVACSRSSEEVVRALLEAKSDPNILDKNQWNCFHIAAREGHSPILEVLLDHSPECWRNVARNGRTPLHTAAFHCRLAAIQLMYSRCSYSPDERDLLGNSPVMEAAKGDHVECLRFLVKDMKADLGVTDRFGHGLIHLCAESGAMNILRLLLEEFNMSVSPSTSTQATPLHMAAAEGKVESINCLLTHSPHVINHRDSNGHTALDFAVAKRHQECTVLLKDNGGLRGADLESFCRKP